MNVNIRPIHLAASNGNICILKLLLNKHDDVNIEDKYGSTPLHYSVNSLNEDSTKFLIENGANPYSLNDEIGIIFIWNHQIH